MYYKLRKESHFLKCYKFRSAALDYLSFKLHIYFFFSLVANEWIKGSVTLHQNKYRASWGLGWFLTGIMTKLM